MNPGLTGYRGSPCNCGCVFTSKSSMGGMGVGDNLPKCFQNLLTALCGEQRGDGVLQKRVIVKLDLEDYL